MDEFLILIYILVGIAFFCAMVYLVFYLSRNVFNPLGKGSGKKTAGILSRFALLRGFKVLSNVELEDKGQRVFIENMIVGYFGIFMVHTCGARGEYYGQMDGEKWKRVLDQQSVSFANPALEMEKAKTVLRAILSKNKVYNIPMESVVYLTSRSKKTTLYITHDGGILMPGKLSGYLDKTKFEEHKGVDIDKVVSVIEANRIKGD